MSRARVRKILGDLSERRGRFLMAVLAMAVGVFQLSSMLYTYAILRGTLGTMFERTRPASAILISDGDSDALIDSVRQVPGVADAEARPVIMGRVRVGRDEWAPGMFFVVRDFRKLRLDTFEPREGAWPPGDAEVLLDETALQVARVRIGESLTIRTVGGRDQQLKLSGTVHDEGLAPAWMDHVVPGFVSWDSALRTSAGSESRQIRIRVADAPLDEGYIHEVADRVKAMLERQGHRVSWINMPPPGKHPHADQMAAFLYLLGAFGAMSFVLSTALVAGMVQGLLAEQVRQVGIMKAIGASSRQVATLYLAQVSILAAAALALGLPAGMFAGRIFARSFAAILNGHITNTGFPWWLTALEIVAGIAVPLLVSLGPVLQASRMSVHQALGGNPGPRAFGLGRLDRTLMRIAWLPRPLLLSLRTTFLRRGRLALTVGMLAVGGAMFMSALNISDAWKHAVDQDFRLRHYQLVVTVPHPAPISALERILRDVPSVSRAEYWPQGSAFLAGPGSAAGSLVEVVGPDPNSRLLELPLLSGRWTTAGDSASVVINQGLFARDTTLKVGREIALRIHGQVVAWKIVGIVRELTPMPIVYAPPLLAARVTGLPGGSARTARVVLRRTDEASQLKASSDLEQAFSRAHLEISGIQRISDNRKAILDHLVIIISVLTLAALIMLLVGAIGLTSTLSLNVVQRTREIGILGAIGATPATISGHVWAEGLVIGLLSWGLATALSAPVSYVMETVTGRIFFKAPLDFYMTPVPALIWLGLVVVLASAGSLYPAWRASRLTVREALSYE